MALVKSKASCFIDCLEIALQANAQVIARDYRDIINNPDVDPDTEGYHPSIVNQCLLERFGLGVAEIDVLPVNESGETYSDDPTRYVTSWFKRPGFQCVLTGPRNTNGEEHANAYTSGKFFDANGAELNEPNIQIRKLWVLGIPVLEAQPDAGQTEQAE